MSESLLTSDLPAVAAIAAAIPQLRHIDGISIATVDGTASIRVTISRGDRSTFGYFGSYQDCHGPLDEVIPEAIRAMEEDLIGEPREFTRRAEDRLRRARENA